MILNLKCIFIIQYPEFSQESISKYHQKKHSLYLQKEYYIDSFVINNKTEK